MRIDRDLTLEKIKLVSSIGDIDLNGKADLMTTDHIGEGKIYFEFCTKCVFSKLLFSCKTL